MQKNKMLYIFMGLLVIGILGALMLMVRKNNFHDLPLFIVSALTAFGTCGVMILSIFPYRHSDKLSARLYKRPSDGAIMLKVTNKTGRCVRLGASNLDSPHADNYAVWWEPGVEQTLENAHNICSMDGDVLVIPPYDSYFHQIDIGVFNGYPTNQIRLKVRTNTGYRCLAKNEL